MFRERSWKAKLGVGGEAEKRTENAGRQSNTAREGSCGRARPLQGCLDLPFVYTQLPTHPQELLHRDTITYLF